MPNAFTFPKIFKQYLNPIDYDEILTTIVYYTDVLNISETHYETHYEITSNTIKLLDDVFIDTRFFFGVRFV